MADEEAFPSDEPAAVDDDVDGAPPGKDKSKARVGLGRRATRSLRRARSVYENNEWRDSNEGSFLIQEAGVLALMDLAEAIREQRPPSG